jgi:hypothetical protein
LIYEQYQAASPGADTFFALHIRRVANQLSVVRDPGDDDLSKAELILAERVFARWRNRTFEQAHDQILSLPECGKNELHGDRIPIELILKKTGRTAAQIKALALEIRAEKHLKSAIESASLASQTR